MSILIATSVVRGSQQGESHGGIFLIDMDGERVAQVIDWNTVDIDWQGRGWDRGLRGIAFDGDNVYIAASDELFRFTPDFELIDSYRNPYLKHCHEIACHQRSLFLSSTGYDSVLGFDLDRKRYSWALHVAGEGDNFRGTPYDPAGTKGPAPGNQLHINSVYCNKKAMYVSGLRTGGVLMFTGRRIARWATLPYGAHNAQPYRDGILFNDTEANVVRYASPTDERAFRVPQYRPDELTHTDLDDSRIARQSFGRGLCVMDDGIIAAGSSPSTIALHSLEANMTTRTVKLTSDIRNSVHGLEVWPYE